MIAVSVYVFARSGCSFVCEPSGRALSRLGDDVMKRLMAATVLVVLANVASPVRADDQANLTGTWKSKVNFGGQARESTLKLKLDGGKLTGSVTGRMGQEMPIQDGKYEKGEVSFNVVREANGQKFTLKYHGKVTGDEIKGQMEFEREGNSQSIDWEAKRAKK
jgi:hypothetical protein